jgi:hypothetical protein
MLMTMTALGTAMIDAPLVGEAGPGANATGAGEGAFFGGDGDGTGGVVAGAGTG